MMNRGHTNTVTLGEGLSESEREALPGWPGGGPPAVPPRASALGPPIGTESPSPQHSGDILTYAAVAKGK